MPIKNHKQSFPARFEFELKATSSGVPIVDQEKSDEMKSTHRATNDDGWIDARDINYLFLTQDEAASITIEVTPFIGGPVVSGPTTNAGINVFQGPMREGFFRLSSDSPTVTISGYAAWS